SRTAQASARRNLHYGHAGGRSGNGGLGPRDGGLQALLFGGLFLGTALIEYVTALYLREFKVLGPADGELENGSGERTGQETRATTERPRGARGGSTQEGNT